MRFARFWGHARRHPGTPGHALECPDCRGRLEAHRRYIAALRDAKVPCAPTSLQARLLAHTQQLAAQAETGGVRPQRSRRREAVRAGLSALAGAAAASAALAVTAYAVAGEAPQRSPQGPMDASLVRTATGARPAPAASGDRDGESSPSEAVTALLGGPGVLVGGAHEDPAERIARGLRVVFGASGQP
ncbi:hypothetical protein [Sinomonas halotolerans]|uniref:Anti-sigma factor n=1 Tax=Sinomonas halotolerans TaxID=1644133 RepID=A0ABU9WW87_9MICC